LERFILIREWYVDHVESWAQPRLYERDPKYAIMHFISKSGVPCTSVGQIILSTGSSSYLKVSYGKIFSKGFNLPQ